MYKISKEFHFSAGHYLTGLPEEHPCSRQHGHNYVVTVHLKSKKLNEIGFVEDYRSLDFIKKFIDDTIDHKNLNDVFAFNPTAENLAKKFYEIFHSNQPKIYAITVKETEKTAATYTPEKKKSKKLKV